MILAEQFRRDASNQQPELLRQRHWFIKAKHVRARREEIADQLDDDLLSLATTVMMATEDQLQAFEGKLDTYDEATVGALMENQEALDLVNERLANLLSRAHEMEDGRRVFKTQDGTKVFDEHGNEVSRGELDFEIIRSDKPTWESYEPHLLEQHRLQTERTEILEYQEKLDTARERIGDGDISEDELKELDDDLAASMPTSVRKLVPEMDMTAAPDVNAHFASAAPRQAVDAPTIRPDNAPRLEF